METKHQALTSDAATNSTTTFQTVMSTKLSPGTYAFRYWVCYQAAAATTGVKFQFTFTGTASRFLASSQYQTTGGAAATGAADQVTTTTAQLVEGWSARALSSSLGPSLSVDTANADMLLIIDGLIVVTVQGTLNLQHASEVVAASTVKAGSSAVFQKVA